MIESIIKILGSNPSSGSIPKIFIRKFDSVILRLSALGVSTFNLDQAVSFKLQRVNRNVLAVILVRTMRSAIPRVVTFVLKF